MLHISPAPLLVRVDNVTSTALASETGGDAAQLVREVYEMLEEPPDTREDLLQQTNFRLRRPVPVTALKFWLIAGGRDDIAPPERSFYALSHRAETASDVYNSLGLIRESNSQRI
jgi:hypothetical protein